MLTDGNYTFHDEHCIMYRIVESLCCAPKHCRSAVFNYFFKRLHSRGMSEDIIK